MYSTLLMGSFFCKKDDSNDVATVVMVIGSGEV